MIDLLIFEQCKVLNVMKNNVPERSRWSEICFHVESGEKAILAAGRKFCLSSAHPGYPDRQVA